MLNPRAFLGDALGQNLAQTYRPELWRSGASDRRRARRNGPTCDRRISSSDALYHDAQHKALSALVTDESNTADAGGVLRTGCSDRRPPFAIDDIVKMTICSF